MTDAQVLQFKRAYIIEDLARAMYYAAVEYHGLAWPLWQGGLRCADKVQHARQQRFRDEATAEMIIATPEHPEPVRVISTGLRSVTHTNVVGQIGPREP